MIRLAFLLVLWAAPLWAVEPGEVLQDPALEARAREISRELRCLVCRNESIDDSNASLARDLRVLVRERLVAGDSDRQVVDFVVARYGEYVLLKPDSSGSNMVLWYSSPIVLLLLLALGWKSVKSRNRAAPAPLSEAENKRLSELLKD